MTEETDVVSDETTDNDDTADTDDTATADTDAEPDDAETDNVPTILKPFKEAWNCEKTKDPNA